MTWLLTFHTCGTYFDASMPRIGRRTSAVLQPSFRLCARRRAVVLDSLREVCRLQEWSLLAAHVRANHLHIVVHGHERPRQTLSCFKTRASCALRSAGLGAARTWAAGGSCQKLETAEAVRRAVRHVVRGQGAAMTVYQG